MFQSCEKKRTVLSTKSTGYKFAGHNDHELESNKKDNKGLNRMTLKNTGKKQVINKDGEVIRTEERGDLYSDRDSLTVRESGRSFRGQDSNFGSQNYKSKSFKTPEYLKRDEFASKSFREGTQQSKASEKSFTRRLFKTEAARDDNKEARDGTKSYRNADEFKTSENRSASKAQENAALPTGKKQSTGYKQSTLTVDDVRKLVHPESIR